MTIKNCAICSWLSKGISEQELQEENWKGFRLCKKHLSYEKEIKVAQCACGNQDLEYKSGLSKKTGKKWQGWKCAPCDIMMGMDGVPWGQPKNSQPTPVKTQKTAYVGAVSDPLLAINKKLDQILAILKTNFQGNITTDAVEEVNDDPVPF